MYINIDPYLYTKLQVTEIGSCFVVTVKGNKNSKKRIMKAEDREFARQRAKKRCFRLSFKVYKVEIKGSLCSRAMPKQADYQTLRTPKKGAKDEVTFAIKKKKKKYYISYPSRIFKAHKRTVFLNKQVKKCQKLKIDQYALVLKPSMFQEHRRDTSSPS
ncbi:hypothetical protein RIR_jg32329.t1 [Rhizophagus irregularis DAOM 181602=DAOM 197198]|nr:hypothetical protein RIR_jg32329.t1 [Rhizophagus irregularis DAOM 181602=DAOM 197198]